VHYVCGYITLLQSIINLNQLITNVLKQLFGLARRDNMTGIFMYLSLLTADTIVYNARILFVNRCAASCNRIVRWFADIDV